MFYTNIPHKWYLCSPIVSCYIHLSVFGKDSHCLMAVLCNDHVGERLPLRKGGYVKSKPSKKHSALISKAVPENPICST